MPCCLCGEIHPLRIHAILIRKIRTEVETNTDINIISIYCIGAKKKGWQYTKRILPSFVIPECNITLDKVLRCIKKYPAGRINYEEAGFILGTLDDRTIERHILMGRRMIEKSNVVLAEVLSSLSGYAHIPEMKVGESGYAYLQLLVAEADLTAIRMGATNNELTTEIIYVHGTYVWEKCRNSLKTVTDRVFHSLLFFDTR